MRGVLGLDLSLTSSGWARSTTDFGTLEPPKGQDEGILRNNWIMRQVLELAKDVDMVVIEGYSFGQARGTSQVVYRAELGGLVRWALWRRDVPFVDVPPATLKKYATGTGKGKKVGIVVAAAVRLGYTGDDDNEVDALWLWNLGATHYGLPGHVPVPQSHYGDGAKKIPWPRITIAPAAAEGAPERREGE